MKPRTVALLLVATLAPLVAFRLAGVALWVVLGACNAVACALAVHALADDGALRTVFARRGLDLTLGLASGVVLYAVVRLATRAVAPPAVLDGLLRYCTVSGVALVRPDVTTAFGKLAEALRAETCRDYGVSLALQGQLRGACIVAIAVLEEIAWRGGVQQALADKLGSTRGWLAASTLAAVAHLATGRPALAALALSASLVFGALYRTRHRLVPGIAAHVAFSYLLFYYAPVVSFRRLGT